MVLVEEKRNSILLQSALVLAAVVFYAFTVFQFPLADYDEATYAKVTIDTLQSDSVLTLKLGERDWFEKPPLFFWLAMASVKIFGPSEAAFRVPSVFFAILSLWFVYAITRTISRSFTVAAAAFLVLLFSGIFYVYGREARLDTGIIAAILAALYFTIIGWKRESKLFWIFPAVAVGLLLKNAVAALAFPIILIYSAVYRQWEWLKSRYLWRGLILSLLIAAPWHVLQHVRFGSAFWENYFLYHIVHRAISTLTGSADPFIYFTGLWRFNHPWTVAVLATLALVLSLLIKERLFGSKEIQLTPTRNSRDEWEAPLLSAIFIIAIFSLSRTRLLPYILPAVPFLAMFLAAAFFGMSSKLRLSENWPAFILAPLLAAGAYFCMKNTETRYSLIYFEERDAGLLLKQRTEEKSLLYVLDWPYLETLNFYSSAEIRSMDILAGSGKRLAGPLYLFTNIVAMRYFYNREGELMENYKNVKVLYQGQLSYLIYSEDDLILPAFSHR